MKLRRSRFLEKLMIEIAGIFITFHKIWTLFVLISNSSFQLHTRDSDKRLPIFNLARSKRECFARSWFSERRTNVIGIPIVFILNWKKVRYSNERLETFIPWIGLVLIPFVGITHAHLCFLLVFSKILEKHLP